MTFKIPLGVIGRALRDQDDTRRGVTALETVIVEQGRKLTEDIRSARFLGGQPRHIRQGVSRWDERSVVFADAADGTARFILPDLQREPGSRRVFFIKKIDSSANPVRVETPTIGQPIEPIVTPFTNVFSITTPGNTLMVQADTERLAWWIM